MDYHHQRCSKQTEEFIHAWESRGGGGKGEKKETKEQMSALDSSVDVLKKRIWQDLQPMPGNKQADLQDFLT